VRRWIREGRRLCVRRWIRVRRWICEGRQHRYRHFLRESPRSCERGRLSESASLSGGLCFSEVGRLLSPADWLAAQMDHSACADSASGQRAFGREKLAVRVS
jgi:hypothetical protein